MAEENKDVMQDEVKEAATEEKAVTEETDTENVTKENTPAEEAVEETGKKDKKKDKESKKLKELEEKIKELEDARLRQMAEFQNFRNRTEREKAQMFDMGSKNVIEKILPVVDNFERGLATVPADEANLPFAEGMNKIYKQLMTELDNLGVKPIEAKGNPFDPNFHNAVMQVESEELESGVVAEELQKGYTYHDTVVRHSMVSVVS